MSTEGFIFSADGKTLLECKFTQLGTTITVPSGCTRTANAVFAEAPVRVVTIPDTVTEIGENLFSASETLEEVNLSENVTELKPFTFAGCTSLKKVSISEKIKSLPEGLFFGCSSLTEIPFRSGMEVLETDVLRDCESIISIQLPPGLKTIKKGSLSGCSNLSTIIFPASLETIEDRSLAGLKSLKYMRFSDNCQNFFVDENYGCLYQITEEGCILIKCPVNQEKIYLVENAVDVHTDAFEGCFNLSEVYISEESGSTVFDKLSELIPGIDINSYSDEISEEEEFSAKIEHLGEDLDKVKVDEKEFTELDEFSQNKSTVSSVSDKPVDDDYMIDINEILNSQCIRNDSLDEGYRPVTTEELEYLFADSNFKIDESPKETEVKEETKIEEETSKPKRRGRPRKNAAKDTESDSKSKTSSKSKPKKTVISDSDNAEEPRILRAMKDLSSHQMVIEEDEFEKESVYGDMKELFVFADGVAPSTNDFSSHLVKFSKDVAKKYGFTKIYFFENLPLDNPEFMYALKSFGNVRNILYACNKPCPEKITEGQKELLDAAGINLPKEKLKNVKGYLADSGMKYPVKILVQDNYIEGLLYCAEKFREEHGIK
ncbi:MAG: leucine-rich repeat protein [Treponema sp.]|uniref:leucine-rich repeat domain-containing protein n=1 Tax=Treponema sp. TaxID=166 RepID=UPI00298EC7E8|nr:leucine-rich repeat protein [Treponema sp.]MBR5933065.1 leucine-rich repeat protein [Treponema sp.]